MASKHIHTHLRRDAKWKDDEGRLRKESALCEQIKEVKEAKQEDDKYKSQRELQGMRDRIYNKT